MVKCSSIFKRSSTAKYAHTNTATAIVKSIRVTEDSGNNDTIAVELYDNSATATFKITGTLTISASTSTELLSAPLVLEESDAIKKSQQKSKFPKFKK